MNRPTYKVEGESVTDIRWRVNRPTYTGEGESAERVNRREGECSRTDKILRN